VAGSTTSPSRPQATRLPSAVRPTCDSRYCHAACSPIYPAPGHDSSITVVYPSGPDAAPQAVHTIRTPSLPYVAVLWLSETSLVAAGHDCQPVLFSGSLEEGWSLVKSLDESVAGGAKPGILTPSNTGGVGRLNSEAFRTFRSADSRGATHGSGGGAGGAGGSGSTELNTVHQNTITKVKAFETSPSGEVTRFSTSGVDGRLVIWTVGGSGGAGGLAGKVGRMAL
jgi:actin related protein 2/3 complex subunit 1A/1B